MDTPWKETYHDNINFFDNYKICPRVMIYNSTVDTEVQMWHFYLVSRPQVSPWWWWSWNIPCCKKKGVNIILSGFSTTPIREVIEAGDGSQNAYAQQLNLMRDEEANLAIIRNAERSGYKASYHCGHHLVGQNTQWVEKPFPSSWPSWIFQLPMDQQKWNGRWHR